MARRLQWKRLAQTLDRFHQAAFSPKYLLYTNIGISVGLSMVGDTMEQSYERFIGELPGWNRIRTVRMGISGFTVGLVCHYWYQYLDYLYPHRTFKVVIIKILLDQFICSPFYIAVFFLTMAILEDNTWEELKQEIKDKALILYAAEWTVWPLAQFINFLLIRPQYRVFYDNTISLGYDIYTSQVKYRKKPEPKTE
ncbi:mpv17-like protein 2 [Drosophila subpulchrella]|uniref:mpv17-like protein 2 n=1 Tax=Drosophila subpulchrella TaxID=1486046 RepID=UPI0018A15F5E|nr:mpv17-like protein 2 [Drosophila subpulchrella]